MSGENWFSNIAAMSARIRSLDSQDEQDRLVTARAALDDGVRPLNDSTSALRRYPADSCNAEITQAPFAIGGNKATRKQRLDTIPAI